MEAVSRLTKLTQLRVLIFHDHDLGIVYRRFICCIVEHPNVYNRVLLVAVIKFSTDLTGFSSAIQYYSCKLQYSFLCGTKNIY